MMYNYNYSILGSYCSQYEEDIVQVPQRSEFTVLWDRPNCIEDGLIQWNIP